MQTANAATVSAALTRYFAVHASIFGNYTSRFPPKPAALMQLAGTQLVRAYDSAKL